ncbi:MAG: hypothetical protein V7604_1625 [Hyphomicrobiales bacterium]|jgi:hypothetical protein
MMREVEYLVANDGRDWCVSRSGTVQGRYPMRQEAVRAAAQASRQSKEAGVPARVVVSIPKTDVA